MMNVAWTVYTISTGRILLWIHVLAIIKQPEQKQTKTGKYEIYTTKLAGHKLLCIYKVIYVYIKYDRLPVAMKQKINASRLFPSFQVPFEWITYTWEIKTMCRVYYRAWKFHSARLPQGKLTSLFLNNSTFKTTFLCPCSHLNAASVKIHIWKRQILIELLVCAVPVIES